MNGHGVVDRRLLEARQRFLTLADRLAPSGVRHRRPASPISPVCRLLWPGPSCIPSSTTGCLPPPGLLRRRSFEIVLSGHRNKHLGVLAGFGRHSSSARAASAPGSATTSPAGGASRTASDGRPRALCDWKKAKSSGLDGSAMMRWLDDSMMSESISTSVRNAWLLQLRRHRDFPQLARRIAARSKPDDQRVTGKVDDRIDEHRPARLFGRRLLGLHDFRRRRPPHGDGEV